VCSHRSSFTYVYANANIIALALTIAVSLTIAIAVSCNNPDSSADQGSNPEADRASGGVANGIRFADCDSHRVANDDYSDASSQPHERACHSER